MWNHFVYGYVFVCLTMKIIFSRHIILSDSFTTENKCKIFEIMIIHYKFLCVCSRNCEPSAPCKHTAEEEVPKCAICCDLSTKSLGVRDVEISLTVLISLPPESHLKVHRFLPLLWYKCLWCSLCFIGNVLVYYIFINENHLLNFFYYLVFRIKPCRLSQKRD